MFGLETKATANEAVNLVGTPFGERNAALSRDGAWVVYESDESGTREVFVGPFPDATAGKWLGFIMRHRQQESARGLRIK